MSEYLSKKAVLEWLKEQQKRQEEKRDRLEIDHPYWEYHEGAADYLSLAVEEFESGAFDADTSEIQRLRAALHKITQIYDDPNLHDLTACQEMNRVAKEALSTTIEPTNAAKAEWPKAEGDGDDAQSHSNGGCEM